MAYAVFGDSFVEHLRRYTKGDLGFQHQVDFFGAPGMTTRNKFETTLDEMLVKKPRFVFVILGGNDINTRTSPEAVFRSLKEVIEELRMCGVERVFMCAIQSRSKFRDRYMTEVIFNKMRNSINDKLHKFMGPDFVSTRKDLKFPKHFNRDGVHPGKEEGGLLQLQRIIKKTFKRTLRRVVKK